MTEKEQTRAVYCHDVTKVYGKGETAVAALRGISFELFLGELLMLVGPSGCGKTTLLSVVAGILKRNEGLCEVLNTDLQALPVREQTRFRRNNIGFIFQAYNLVPTLSAAENCAVPLLIQGISYPAALKQAHGWLERVGLSHRSHAPPRDLSGGEQQRVAICRALIHEPALIVCDEPTSALDHETGTHIVELLRETARSAQRALLVVTHDARIFPYADRIARMDDGHIIEVNSQ